METKKKKRIIPNVPGPKVNYPISGCPVVYNVLDNDADKAGMTFSVYCAKALEEHKPLKERSNNLAKELAEEKKKTASLNSQLTIEKSLRQRESTESKSKIDSSAANTIQLQKKVEELTKQLAERDTQLGSEKLQRLKETTESKGKLDSSAANDVQMKKIIEDFRKELSEKDAHLALFKDERVLKIFERVKGRTQEIETWDGEIFRVTYNHPSDVAKTIIYSFKANV